MRYVTTVPLASMYAYNHNSTTMKIIVNILDRMTDVIEFTLTTQLYSHCQQTTHLSTLSIGLEQLVSISHRFQSSNNPGPLA